MNISSLRRNSAVVAICAVVAACASGNGSDSVNTAIYALGADDERQQLNGSTEWERETWQSRSNLAPDAQFMVTHPSIGNTQEAARDTIRLRRVAWVRSAIDEGERIGPVNGPQWVAPELEAYQVPFRIQPVEGEENAVLVVPERPLEPGLYSLQVGEGSERVSARIGIRWPTVDRARYAAANCVDRYAGGSTAYRLCSEQRVSSEGPNLRIHLVEPEINRDPGRPASAVVKGVVVNVSDEAQIIPLLQGQLRDRQGNLLKSWVFSAERERLRAGGSVPFQTRIDEVPPATARVTVRLAVPFDRQSSDRLAR